MASKSKSDNKSTTSTYTVKDINWTYGTTDYRTWQWMVSGTSTSTRGPYPHKTDTRNRQWQTMLGWKSFRDANGFLPTQPYSDVQTEITRGSGFLQLKHSTAPGNSQELSGNLAWDINPSLFVDSAFANRLVDEAKISALLKAKDVKVNIPVLFGEGRKTVGMLFETAGKVYRAYSNVRKGRFSKAAKELGIAGPKGPSNNWLSYQYGWLPLLSDVKGLAELAAQQTVGRAHRFSVRSSRKAQVSHGRTFANGIFGEFHGSNSCKGYTEYICEAGLLLEVKNRAPALASQVGITDPALVVWELVPFSFVFDWFISVGDWLQVQTALTGLAVKTGYTSTTASVFGTSTYVETDNRWSGSVDPARYRYRSYGRSAWDGSMPLASLAFVDRDPLGIKRFISAMALYKQRSR